MVAPRGNSNTDRGGASTGVNAGSGGFKGPGVSGLNSSSRTAASSGAKSATAGKGPAASQAAAKANAAKTQQTSQQKSPVARSVPGTSQAAAKNTALGKAAESAKQNVRPAVSNPVSFSGKADQGIYGRFTASLPSMRPGANVMGGPVSRQAIGPGGWMNMQKAPGGYTSGFVNANQVPVVNWSGSFGGNPAFRNLSQQGNKLYRAIEDTALRTNQPINVFSGGRRGGGMNHKTGNAIDSFMRDPVSGVPVGQAQVGKWASFPIAGVNSLMGRTVPVAQKIDAALSGPYKQFSNNVYDTVYQNPDAYSGVRGAMRYGGDFGSSILSATTARDFMHHDVTPGRGAASQPANHRAAVARANQGTLSSGTMLAGGGLTPGAISAPSPAAMPAQAPVRMASAAIGSIPMPRPRPSDLRAPIPRPTPRPGALNAPALAQNPYAANYAVGVPRARPPGVGPERVLGVENYIDPNTGVSRNAYDTPQPSAYAGYGAFNAPVRFAPVARNAYDTQRAGGYSGYGEFNTPDRTAPLTRNAFDTQRATPAPNLGYGPASPLGNMPPAAERPRLMPPTGASGMSFTPNLPGPQKDFYDRVAQTPGPVQQYGLPAYPGAQPAGTYTAPYDRAPRMSPFGNVGQEYHQHTAPPTPSQYRNEMPPAAPNMGTPGSQTAETAPSLWQTTNDLFQQAKTAAEPYVKQAQEGSEELKKAVETYGEDAVLTYLQQQAGQVPQSLRGYGEANENQDRNRSLMAAGAGLMGGGVPSSGGQPSSGGGSLSQAQMTVLLANMQANGATPEEIAYVQSMMATATA